MLYAFGSHYKHPGEPNHLKQAKGFWSWFRITYSCGWAPIARLFSAGLIWSLSDRRYILSPKRCGVKSEEPYMFPWGIDHILDIEYKKRGKGSSGVLSSQSISGHTNPWELNNFVAGKWIEWHLLFYHRHHIIKKYHAVINVQLTELVLRCHVLQWSTLPEGTPWCVRS